MPALGEPEEPPMQPTNPEADTPDDQPMSPGPDEDDDIAPKSKRRRKSTKRKNPDKPRKVIRGHQMTSIFQPSVPLPDFQVRQLGIDRIILI
jgi:hypothetical protein